MSLESGAADDVVTLTFTSGADPIQLGDQAVTLGRAHVRRRLHALLVSREQCHVRRLRGGAEPEVEVTTADGAVNSTIVYTEVAGTRQARPVAAGEKVQLRKGDGIALTPCDHDRILISTGPPASLGAELKPSRRASNSGSQQEAAPTGLCADPPISTASNTKGRSSPEAVPAVMQDGFDDHPGPSVTTSTVMLVLCGTLGAGKSTFAKALVEASEGRWCRINQDTIRDGKAGSRKQCVDAAAKALRSGHSCIIDRCNFNRSQRQDFVRLAQQQNCSAHAVLLKLPAKLCAKRVAERDDHEGGVQGKQAAPHVYRMWRKLEQDPPRKPEGFKSVRTCTSAADVAAALSAWQAWHQDTVPADAVYSAAVLRHRTLAPALPAPQPPPSPIPPPAASAGPPDRGAPPASPAAEKHGAPRNAFQLLMHPPCRSPPSAAATSRKLPGPPAPKSAAGVGAASGLRGSGGAAVQQPRGSWAGALERQADDPDTFAQPPFMADAYCVAIRDKFPKALRHWLVVAREPQLHDPAALTSHHLPLLSAMHAMALQCIHSDLGYCGSGASRDPAEFWMGFHSVPSMRRLHLHVISSELDSPQLKHKRHWNSFTTAFFLRLPDVQRQLQGGGRLQLRSPSECEQLLKGPMTCPHCHAPLPRMPDVRAHIHTCASRRHMAPPRSPAARECMDA